VPKSFEKSIAWIAARNWFTEDPTSLVELRRTRDKGQKTSRC
jgi:hypothetical protein